VRSTLDELLTELAELKAFVESIAKVNSALADHQDSVVKTYLSIRRRFDYAAFAVALYASFEKFIEGLIAAFAQLESRRLEYSKLPEGLRKKHLSQTLKMVERGRIGEGRYAHLNTGNVVKNLIECLHGTIPYTLNDAAIVAHDHNLRVPEIDELFAAVGMEKVSNHVRQVDDLVQWHCNLNGLLNAPKGGVPATTIERRLNDIVERRNEVAHRGGNPDNLPAPEAMSEDINFIENLARSLFGLVIGRYLKLQHTESENRIPLKLGEGPFEKGTTIVVDAPSHRLFVGQPVFAIVESTGARWGRIQSLEIDNTDVEEVVPGANALNGIGVCLDFKCPKKNKQLFALAVDDDLVWAPPEEKDPR
jgi:hypothetical protein